MHIRGKENILPHIFQAPLLADKQWLGALNIAFVSAIACWIAELIVLTAGWSIPTYNIAIALFSLGSAITVYGLLNAAWIRVTRITVALPQLPPSWQGRTVALETNIHLGHISGPHFLSRVIARLRSIRPDAVFISGDMFDGTTAGLDCRRLARLHGTARRLLRHRKS